MRARIVSVLAYVGAAVTLVVAACVPFVLMGVFTNAVAHAGLHVDAAYSGQSSSPPCRRNTPHPHANPHEPPHWWILSSRLRSGRWRRCRST